MFFKKTLTPPNPAQNICYIQITLLLADGTELWNSGLFAPGEQSEPIVFSQPLAAGEYQQVDQMKYFLQSRFRFQIAGKQGRA